MALFPTDIHARYLVHIVEHHGMKVSLIPAETAIIIHLPFENLAC